MLTAIGTAAFGCLQWIPAAGTWFLSAVLFRIVSAFGSALAQVSTFSIMLTMEPEKVVIIYMSIRMSEILIFTYIENI